MTDTATTTPKKKFRKLWKWITATVLVSILLLVALLPTIASLPIFRSFIIDAVSAQVNGSVSIGNISLSWLGAQTVDNFNIVGVDKKSSVLLSATLRNSLLSVLTGNLGEIDVTMSGKVTGEIDADGKMSLLSLVKNTPTTPTPSLTTPPASKSAPATQSTALNIAQPLRITISGFDIDIANAAGPSFSMNALKAKVAIGGKGPVTLQIAAQTKIGDKPGAISANGTFANVFNAADQFDPTTITGSLTAEVDGVLVPSLGSAVEMTRATFSIDAAAAKPIDIGANISVSVNGQMSPLQAKLQANRPGAAEKIAAWAKDPRTWAGTVSAQNIPTVLFEKFTKDMPFNWARDIGPTLSLSATTNSATGFDLSLNSANIQLTSSASIDVNTGAVQGKTTQLNASLSPQLLKQFNVITVTPLPVTVALQSFYLPPILADGKINLAQISAAGSINIAAAQFMQEASAPVVTGPVTLSLTAAPLGDKVDIAFKTTLNGTPITTTATLTQLMQNNVFAFKSMNVNGATALGPFDPTLLPGIPAHVLNILQQVQPGASTIQSTLAGNYQQGTLQFKLQCVPGIINAKAQWDAKNAVISLENTSITMTPTLAQWASQGALQLSAPAKCTLAAGPVQLDRPALEQGLTAFMPAPISIFVEQLSISKAPGLTGTAMLQGAVIRGAVDVDGPELFKGDVSVAAAILNGLPSGAGNSAISELSLQATVESDLDSPKSTIAIAISTLSLNNSQFLSESVQANNVRLQFSGPLSLKGAVASQFSMDLRDAVGAAAKISGELKMQSLSQWTATVAANEVSMQRIARMAGLGDVPQWTSTGPANIGKLKADFVNDKNSIMFGVNADLGRISANINGSRATNGTLTLSKSNIAASIPGDVARNYFDRGAQKSPIRNLSDLTLTLDIASVSIPAVHGVPNPLATSAAINTKARIDPFQVTFATALLAPAPAIDPATGRPTAPEKIPASEKVASLAFGTTDISLQTSGAQSALVNLKGSLAPIGQPAKPLTIEVKAQNLADTDGKLNMAKLKLAAAVNISEFPSPLVDAIMNGDGFIQNLAGPVFSLQLAGQTGFEASDRFKGHIESPSITLDIPAVRVVDSLIVVVPNEAIVFQLRPDENIRQNILRPINPILGDIEFKQQAINTTVSMVRAPIPFDMAKTDARFTIEVGEVELEKKGQIISLLNIATVKDNKSTIPGLVNPLTGEINKGILTYKEFKIQVGKMGKSWQQTILSDANINLVTHPAYANEINVRYPLEGVTNALAGNGILGKSMGGLNNILGNTTAEMRQAIQMKVVFTGPLQGDQLKMTVEPNLELPKGDALLKGLGSIAEGILGGKSGGTTPPPAGSPPSSAPPAKKDPLGGLLDGFLKKNPKN